MNKKVVNIVFYKFNSNNKDIVKACIFYNDGTVKNVSKQEAVKEAIKIAKEEKALKDLNSLINKNRIYAMSGSELTKRFNEFVSYDIVENHIDNALDNIVLTETDKVYGKDNNPTKTTIIPIEYDLINRKVNELNNEQELTEEKEEEIIYDNEIELEDDINNNNINKKVAAVTPVVLTAETLNNKIDLDNEKEEDLLADDLDKDVVKMNNATYYTPNKPVEEKEEKAGVLSKVKNFVKGRLLPIAVAASLIAGTGVGYSLAKDHKLGGAVSKTSISSPLNNNDEEAEIEVNENTNEEIVNTGNTNTEETSVSKNNETVEVNYANNDYYNGLTYGELLEKTTNPIQKEVMKNMSEALDWYNGEFADAYVEKGKDIRAALTWDEMIALQIAYNDYDKHMLHAIFNGAEIDSNELENAYKNATLQSTGAYVIEKEPNLVDVTKLVHNEEGIKFVQKYQNMLEAAKNATGEEKLELIKAFYSELYKDFPITEEIRTEGISHADYRKVESYKLAVAPMVAAAEIMFQNYEIDHTLTDQAIEYFNDLGLCNIAQKKFDRAEMVSLTNCEYDETNPLYEQFKNAKILELKTKGIYVIDDAHRDLSQLDRFQELVNWHFKMNENGHFELETWYTTETYTTKKTWTEKHTKKWTETKKTETSDRDKAVKEAGEDKVRKAEEKVDKQIEEENKKAKEKAEKEAEKNRKRMQEEADKNKKELEKQVEEDDKDMQNDLNDSNNKDQNGEKVNENDFGDHNVTFDNEDKDKDGNKSDSVKDLTTDGTGSNKDLGDPNETGKAFDEEGQKMDPEITYDEVQDKEVDKTETPEENTNNNNNNNDNTNNNDNNSNSNNDTPADLGDPNDFDNNNSDNSNENNYDVEYDDEIDYSEDDKNESKHEESKKEEVKEEKHEEKKEETPKKEEVKEEKHEEKKEEAPKKEEKHEEPKHEEKHEEPKQEAPKHEEKHEEPKHEEPKHEEKHEEPKQEAPKQEENHEESSSKSNEQAVNDYVENLAQASTDDAAKELVLS